MSDLNATPPETLNNVASWRRLIARLPKPDVGAAITRFPVSSFGAAVTTLLILALTELNPDKASANTMVRTAAAYFAGAIAALPAVLFAESRGWAIAPRQLFAASVAIITGLLVWFAHQVSLQPYIFYTGLLLLAGLAPFANRRPDNANYWMFNHDLWLGFAYGVIASVLVGGGVSAILGTLQYLFAINVPTTVWAQTWTVATLLVAPLVWLSTVPTRFDAATSADITANTPENGVTDNVDGRATDTVVFSGIALLVQYILVPLLLVYAAILYAYAAKVLFQFELPKGQIGWMVSSFGVVGILTALLGWPLRDTGGVIVRFFWRYWFVILVVPVLLLVVGTYERIATYGLTQARYALLLVGVWLALVTVLYGRPHGSRDLRWIAGSLCALLLAASMGPQSLTALPGRLLAAEFERTLAATGYIEDGEVIAAAARPEKLSQDTNARLSSILRELRTTGQLGRLTPLFGGTYGADIFRKTADAGGDTWPLGSRYGYATEAAIAKKLGLAREGLGRRETIATFSDLSTKVVKANTVWMLGPIDAYFSSQDTWSGGTNPVVRVTRSGTSATIDVGSETIAKLDLADLAARLFSRRDSTLAEATDDAVPSPLVIDVDGVIVILRTANFQRDEADAPAELTQLRIEALIPVAKFPDLDRSR